MAMEMLSNPQYERNGRDNLSLSNLTQDDDSTEVEEIDSEDYLEQDIDSHTIEIVYGEKEESKWLIIDGIYICHRDNTSKGNVRETLGWECRGRRQFKCRFRAGTYTDDNGTIKLNFMWKLSICHCEQNKVFPILHKFKLELKHEMKSNYKASFAKVFDDKRRCLIKKYSTNPDLLERISYNLKDKRSFRLLAERARNKCFPKNYIMFPRY